MSPFVMPRTRCGVGVTWGRPSGLRSSSISIDGSVLVDPKGVSKGGGCIDVSSRGWITELVFAMGRGITGSVAATGRGIYGLGVGWNLVVGTVKVK